MGKRAGSSQEFQDKCQDIAKDLANVKTIFPFLFDEFGFEVVDCLKQKSGEFRRILVHSPILAILFNIDMETMGVYVGTITTPINWWGIDSTNTDQFWIGLTQLSDYLKKKPHS